MSIKRKFLVFLLLCLAVPALADSLSGIYNATPPTLGSGNVSPIQLDSKGNLRVVDQAAAVGSVTWGAPTAVAVVAGPTSTTLVAANANRKSLSIWNPVGNAQISYDISGGTAVLTTGQPLLSGQIVSFTGAFCPVGAITFIGTAGQNLVFQEGT